MKIYLGYKTEIDFNGDLLDLINAKAEEACAIVRKDNGKFAVAYYCYNRFGEGCSWMIWTDEEYDNQFKAMIAAGAVQYQTYLKKWIVQDGCEYVTAKGLSKNNLK
jgi:hypothetical protein